MEGLGDAFAGAGPTWKKSCELAQRGYKDKVLQNLEKRMHVIVASWNDRWIRDGNKNMQKV